MGRIAASEVGTPRPVVKWAGGKSRLVDRLIAEMPERIETYVEPFCGGAAVFFALAARGRFARAVLSDMNGDLIACYRAIQNEPADLLRHLRRYRDDHLALAGDARARHYYGVRSAGTDGMDDAQRGARLIFLNKTCFNGLWRVNAAGRFNVPFGRYANPRIVDEANILAAHRALAGVRLLNEDFAKATRGLGPGDFVYFDPPYVPLSKTSSFTAYAKDGFGPDDQRRLTRLLADLYARGVRAMLSNARTPETEKLYREFRFERVPMPRSINSDPSKRGDVDELVVYNEPARRRKAAS